MSKKSVEVTMRKPGVQEYAITLFAMMVDAVIDLKAEPGQWCCISVSALKEVLNLNESEDWFDVVSEAAEIIQGAPLNKVTDRYFYYGNLVNALEVRSDEGLSFEASRNLIAISRGALWKKRGGGR